MPWSTWRASLRPGRSTTTRSPRTTSGPNVCITCTASWAPTPPSPPETRSLTLRFLIRRAWRASWSQLRRQGLHPSPLPLGIRDGCILCNTCNSFACKIHAKSESEVCCVRPALEQPNVELWTNAYAKRLITNAAGDTIVAVEVERNGETQRLESSLFIVSCGAVNSAALMLRSANDKHPTGLANSSGLVGRRYMAHLATMMQGFHPFRKNATRVPEDGGDQRLLFSRAGDEVSAGTYSIAGPHARRDGADGRPSGAVVVVRLVGRARRGLAGHVRRPARTWTIAWRSIGTAASG